MKQHLCIFLAVFLIAYGAAGAEKPNIIFILADDLGYGDVGVFFQNQRREKASRAEPWHLTPKLDSFAGEGMQLRHHYCPAPVCAPSRASLLTGVHQGHANVRDNQFDKALENNHTLATVLKGAGYATAAIGKWGLQGKGSQRGWPAYPTKRGFDFFHGYVRHKDGHAHYPKEDGNELWENEREISEELAGCYTTDLFTARAKKWITDLRSTKPEQPFFLYLAYDTPHAKLQLPPGEYPAGGGEKGGVQWLGKPGRMINTADGVPDSFVHPDYASSVWDHDADPATPDQAWPDVYKRYATDVRRIDDSVGDIVTLLRDLGIDRDTLVVFTTDNGPSKESYLPEKYEPGFFNSFGPMDGIKRDLWEGGIRVGALARWPGSIPAAQLSDMPSMFHDWMPTFAEMAKVPAPARADGVSLLPTLTGSGTQKPATVYVEYQAGQTTPPYPQFEASRRGRQRKQMQVIRMGDFTGVRYEVQKHADPFEIYNVAKDSKQTRNLASELPELQTKMHDAVLRMRRPDPSAPRPYDAELVPAVNGSAPMAAGVTCRTFSQQMPWLARLDDLTPAATSSAIGLGDINLPAGTTASLVTGYINVETAGEYTFGVPGGASALLRIHDATVIDAAFSPVDGVRDGVIRLAAGKHPFRLYWKTGTGASSPALEWASAGMERQALPPSALFRDDK